ncbi:nitroreductase family deazaflavin-dependent oxidoreductase [Streptomyces sp. 3MP-14]|uniref:Nitroreductase family deazaflavin-dependent oxidoreductase n=1 Tax=Streptomyces mimosae TaxID=2586635 RepID=A0A5N6AMH2_9ACTN|nr:MULTISPECIES: nitroreductase family deazaflavin-dependent oxidoreductase [Streptomyces]KAB8168818.1 nitroreductase family deazaflavin-dependent oxidoreductase [Streptomyces mimosae]KAB8177902.1 nitroreductase family deazaflavin-dependent oxidoreductase [Streptomyces sp. 3MP-14]
MTPEPIPERTPERPVAPTAEPVSDSPVGWVAQHVRDYLATDGQRGHRYQGLPTLLLTTRGRRSGLLRRTTLIYGEHEGRYLLVASNGGSPQHPAWYLNLVAHPEVGVQVGAERFTALARTADQREKAPLWALMTEIFPRYDTYQDATERPLPLVVLERREPGGPDAPGGLSAADPAP